ncbi:hypothetical protein ZIOFF_040703 [Zingiber officinale]|uniref:Uncharacterized protein n=1 Tax=Zingiber officinale TaxID=94328 RepID=A0A8J5L4Q8_ZINOF|nr:hypothetical protein ZIOFF_040703 [Zingiber officinale]
MLTEEEAALLSDNKEVVSVFRDRTLQLHTTRSWDFLEAESGVGAERLQHKASNDVIIGIIDTERALFSWKEYGRNHPASVTLGWGRSLRGGKAPAWKQLTSKDQTATESYSLMFAGDAAAEYTPVSEASNCYPGSIDERKASGKILVCVDTDPTLTRRVKKSVAEGAGAKGLILIDEEEKGVPFDSGSFPFAEVGSDVGLQILKYLNSTKKPSAVILASEEAKEIRPAPVVAYFSSRGPGGLTEAILKPDVMAPGVSIVAASIPISDTGTIPTGREPSKFAIKSGTSMACPHVAGAGAFVKSAHPRWSPSAIRSALMTTATVTNNLGRPLTNHKLASASFHDMGAGEMSPLRALSPGLVFDTAIDDYLLFLCRYGYKDQAVRSISGRSNFSCPYNAAASPDLISDINYPSISIAKLERKQTVSRTVTNVGPPNATYTAAVDAPAGVTVQVSPARLSFSRRGAKASYAVAFEARGASKGYGYGSITWSDGAHAVHTVFAVNCV